jgi:hypothetical protein
LTLHIVETFRIIPSVPFEGYKMGYIQTVEEEKIQLLREMLLWRNYSLHIEFASLCPLKSENIVEPQGGSYEVVPQLYMLSLRMEG